jgi:hypothetical protein
MRVVVIHWSYSDNASTNTVDANGNYQYKLRLGTEANSKTKNLIFYDSLENFTGGSVTDKTARWHGVLQSVDTSQPEARGAKPVIYYSTVKNLFLGKDDKASESGEALANRDLINTKIWSTTMPTDKSTITAIAMDLSKKTDGTDMVFPESTGIQILLNMKAPEDKDSSLASQGARAYNGVIDTLTLVNNNNNKQETRHYNAWGYTGIPCSVSANCFFGNWRFSFLRGCILVSSFGVASLWVRASVDEE